MVAPIGKIRSKDFSADFASGTICQHQEWLVHSLTDGLYSSKEARGLLDPAHPRQIAPIVSLEHQRSVLESALEILSTLKKGRAEAANRVLRKLPQLPQANWFAKKLRLPQWSDPLLLLIAAIICHSGGVHDELDGSQIGAAEGFSRDVEDALSMSRAQIAKKVAAREASRLMRFGKNETEKRILVHLYACVILCGQLNPEQSPRSALCWERVYRSNPSVKQESGNQVVPSGRHCSTSRARRSSVPAE